MADTRRAIPHVIATTCHCALTAILAADPPGMKRQCRGGKIPPPLVGLDREADQVHKGRGTRHASLVLLAMTQGPAPSATHFAGWHYPTR